MKMDKVGPALECLANVLLVCCFVALCLWAVGNRPPPFPSLANKEGGVSNEPIRTSSCAKDTPIFKQIIAYKLNGNELMKWKQIVLKLLVTLKKFKSSYDTFFIALELNKTHNTVSESDDHII